MGLTYRQRAFVNYFLDTWNASEAARQAGYKGRADSVGSQLLGNIEIAAEIARRIEDEGVKKSEVFLRLTEQARADIGDFLSIGPDGLAYIDLTKSPGKVHLIKRYQKGRNGATIEMYDAQRALELLGKALGVLRENVHVEQREELTVTTRIVRAKGTDDGLLESAHE
jgi:phage terminase small subunit